MKRQEFSWYLKKPIISSNSNKIPDWLKELRVFRGEVLYEDGMRPAFCQNGRNFNDPCPVDLYSFHLIAKKNDKIAGSLRITPLIDHLCSSSSLALGEGAFLKLINKNGFEIKNMAEISRWTVAKEYKNSFLGFFLGIYGIGLVNEMGLKPFANGGKKIHHMLSLFGGRLFLQDPGPYYIPMYNDEIFFVDIDIKRAPKKVQRVKEFLGNVLIQ